MSNKFVTMAVGGRSRKHFICRQTIGHDSKFEALALCMNEHSATTIVEALNKLEEVKMASEALVGRKIAA